MVTIDRERLISEKQNKKARAAGARLPKEAMLLRDIFKFTKMRFDLLDSSTGLAKSQEILSTALALTFIKQINLFSFAFINRFVTHTPFLTPQWLTK